MCQQNNQEQFIDVKPSQGVKSAFSQAINTFAYILNQMAYTKTIEDSLEAMCKIKNKLNQQNDELISINDMQMAYRQLQAVRDIIQDSEREQNYLYDVCREAIDTLSNILQNNGNDINALNNQLEQLYDSLIAHYLREE